MDKPQKNATGDDSLILYAELSKADIRAVQRRLRDGKLIRILPGVVTSRPAHEWPALIARERTRVLAALCPGAVIGYRSAFAGGVPVEGVMYLTYTYLRKVLLPGLAVQLIKGSGKAPGDAPMMGRELYFPSVPRLLLENLTISRGKVHKSAGRAAVEARLISICEARGEDVLATLREEARALAPTLGLAREFIVLDGLIGGIPRLRRSRHGDCGDEGMQCLRKIPDALQTAQPASPFGRRRALLKRAKVIAAKADTSINALFNAELRYLVESYEAAEAAGTQNFRTLLDFSLGRVDDRAAMTALGIDSDEDLFLLLAQARLPMPRLPEYATRKMVEALKELET